MNALTSKILLYAWTILIFIGCSLPGKDLPKLNLFDQFDKVVHFSFFFILAILAFCAYKINKQNTIKILIISAIYGLAIEFYQMNFVTGRSFDIWDAVADTIGACCSLLLIKRITTFKNNQNLI